MLIGNPLDHESGWKGYLIDGRGQKHQIVAEWELDDYRDNNLVITIPGAIWQERFVLHKTGKVTFHNDLMFYDENNPELPHVDSFKATWMGNHREPRFRGAQTRAFRLFRKRARI
jgi:hypothetical protein